MSFKNITLKNIVRAMYDKADGGDARPFIRDWIMMFEHFKVKGFNRDTFLDECLIEKQRRLKNEDKN